MRPVVLAAVWLMLAVAASANFVFSTAVTPHVADPALVVAGAIVSSALLLIMGGLPRAEGLRRLGAGGMAACLAAGALAIAFAPTLVAMSRYTDSPPGAVVAFWTTAVWGALLVAAAALPERGYVRAGAALVAVTGAAGVLGNWERPSSFSLVVVHGAQEAALVVAGVGWLAALLIIRRYALRHGAAPVYSLVAIGGLFAALAWALPAASWRLADVVPPLMAAPMAASQGLMLALAFYLAIHGGPHLAGGALLVAVPLVSALLFVEEMVGVAGPRPILVEAATWASVVVVTAAAVVLLPAGRHVGAVRTRWKVASGAVAGAALVAAVVALALPGVQAASRGTTRTGAAFSADFTMAGFQTVGGWLVLSVALLAIAIWAEHRATTGRLSALGALATALVAAGTYVHVRYTPLHVWMRWIPPEVQQDYGSEYATIVFTPVPTPVQIAALVLACIAIVLVALARMPAGSAEENGSHPGAGGQDI